MSSRELEEARDELEGFDQIDIAREEAEDVRQAVERQLYTMETFLRDNQADLKKRVIADTEQALKRGRMALVKRADNASLEALSDYLSSYQAHLDEGLQSSASAS
jgi:molecular chaperone DnaK (HSP70)